MPFYQVRKGRHVRYAGKISVGTFGGSVPREWRGEYAARSAGAGGRCLFKRDGSCGLCVRRY